MKQCDIIQDLLPQYAEGLTSAASNEMIEEHLKTCEVCNTALTEIRRPVAVAIPFPKKEVDYMKKVRGKIKKSRIIIGILAFILISAFAKIFLIGTPVAIYDIGNLSYTFSEEENTLTVSGTLNGSGNAVGYTHVSHSKDTNATRISVYSVLVSFVHNDGDFSVTLPYTDDLYIELQESGNREMIFSPTELLPTICEVRDDGIVNYIAFESRKPGDEIKAIVAASADTGVVSEIAEPQFDHIMLTVKNSGTSSLWDEFPQSNIYVYENEGNYYAETPGENIRRLTLEDYNKIRSYMELTPEAFVENLFDSIRFDGFNGVLSFTVPMGLPSEYSFYINVGGRLEMDGGAMSVHPFAEESENDIWEAGQPYDYEFEKGSFIEATITAGVQTSGSSEVLYEAEISVDENGDTAWGSIIKDGETVN